MRPFIASRIESSSSTIEISGFAFGTRPPAPRACDGNDGTRSKALWRRVVFTVSQKMRRTRAPGDYTLVWTELSRGRIHPAPHLAPYPSDASGIASLAHAVANDRLKQPSPAGASVGVPRFRPREIALPSWSMRF